MDVPNKPLELRVPTASLKTILEQNPDVLLKLESIACEKIAEEIVRKSRTQAVHAYEAKLQEVAMKVTREFSANYSKKHNFPEEARSTVEAIAMDKVKAYFEIEGRVLSARLKKLVEEQHAGLAIAIQNTIDAKVQVAFTDIKRQARAEFIEVLQAAKAVL